MRSIPCRSSYLFILIKKIYYIARIVHEPCTNRARIVHETCTDRARTVHESRTNRARNVHETCTKRARIVHESRTNRARIVQETCTILARDRARIVRKILQNSCNIFQQGSHLHSKITKIKKSCFMGKKGSRIRLGP
jgi:hypothetical protein